MKNFQTTRKWLGAVAYFTLLFLAVFSKVNVKAQSFCGTTSGSGSIGQLPANSAAPADVPIYLRIYVHAVAKGNGNDRPTDEEVKQSINILNQDFADHHIYFG